jgi:hypothetical protein
MKTSFAMVEPFATAAGGQKILFARWRIIPLRQPEDHHRK